jgi:sugar phosphate isomerase/epimerase
MKFALQDNLLRHTGNYHEAFIIARDLGFDGMEINFVGKALDAESAGKINSASKTSGLPVTAICGGYRHWIGHFDEAKRLEAIEDLRITLRTASNLGAQGVIAPAAFGMFSLRLPPFNPPRDSDGDRIALLDSLTRIAEFAEQFQVDLLLEPLNRYEDHMINTVEQAVSLIEAVGSSRIRVMADFFHMNVEEKSMSETIAAHFQHIGYFHLADSNRLEPGAGHTDFATSFKLLNQLDYSGYLSLECRLHGEMEVSLRQTLSFLRNLS